MKGRQKKAYTAFKKIQCISSGLNSWNNLDAEDLKIGRQLIISK
jgi:hypothetical protein